MFCYYETASGKLISISSTNVIQPDGISVVELPDGANRNATWNPATLSFDPLPVQRWIDKTDFIRRFSDSAIANIYGASLNNASIGAWLFRLQATQRVDLNSADTINGVNALVAAGLITQAEADGVLA